MIDKILIIIVLLSFLAIDKIDREIMRLGFLNIESSVNSIRRKYSNVKITELNMFEKIAIRTIYIILAALFLLTSPFISVIKSTSFEELKLRLKHPFLNFDESIYGYARLLEKSQKEMLPYDSKVFGIDFLNRTMLVSRILLHILLMEN